MRRVVAVLGAVLMVAVALLVRGVIDGDDDGGGGSRDPDGDGEVTLLCVEELEEVCAALQDDGAIDRFEVEPAGETVDRAAQEDLGADGWLTLGPLPGMADVARQQEGRGASFSDVQGTGYVTAVAVVAHPARVGAFEAACGATLEWTCLGDLARDDWSDHDGESSWGEIKVGLDDPDSAAGLLAAAQAVAAHLDLPTFATNDLENSDADRWLGRFRYDRDVLPHLVTQGAGAFSAVGALDVEAQTLAETAQGADLAIFYPAPMYRVEVVLVAPGTSSDDLVDGDALDGALDDDGWDRADSSDLPSPGALYALRNEL